MEEIKVGEYIRSKDGYIAKIIEVKKSKRDCDTYYCTDRVMASGFYEHIKRHSPNIINLIKEGDYVNGKLIHKVDIRENSAYIYYGNGKTFCDYQIKDIVTKEQYNSMKYIVGE